MKRNRAFRRFAAVFLALFCMAATSTVAFAGGGDGEPYYTGEETTGGYEPQPLTPEEKQAWLEKLDGVALGSDAFFPFSDNIERAVASGVSFIAQPGGSIRDDAVIECCDKFNMVMAFTGLRLFHH